MKIQCAEDFLFHDWHWEWMRGEWGYLCHRCGLVATLPDREIPNVVKLVDDPSDSAVLSPSRLVDRPSQSELDHQVSEGTSSFEYTPLGLGECPEWLTRQVR